MLQRICAYEYQKASHIVMEVLGFVFFSFSFVLAFSQSFRFFPP